MKKTVLTMENLEAKLLMMGLNHKYGKIISYILDNEEEPEKIEVCITDNLVYVNKIYYTGNIRAVTFIKKNSMLINDIVFNYKHFNTTLIDLFLRNVIMLDIEKFSKKDILSIFYKINEHLIYEKEYRNNLINKLVKLFKIRGKVARSLLVILRTKNRNIGKKALLYHIEKLPKDLKEAVINLIDIKTVNNEWDLRTLFYLRDDYYHFLNKFNEDTYFFKSLIHEIIRKYRTTYSRIFISKYDTSKSTVVLIDNEKMVKININDNTITLSYLKNDYSLNETSFKFSHSSINLLEDKEVKRYMKMIVPIIDS